ncbi:bifunctional precorrin-2 dehydrogenase/sirohydrochlorin ferrochelatase [Sulfurimonas sp. SAG-AH-194-I05]|nr:bifunctional precorrin-2 dehydrogenase/sirohydrochlorin ferrochelatase [Sulfurimonas sp. SAG-AH-194-I05]MDF1875426.1 bifunctional precorrin-2 dehydrogenase/sirohydrochlorin ferrochelatase [Sulfurimonas sp. SAG-AH-194-I05]
MAYFPAFIKLDEKKVLIVGGGKIAQEKLEKLLDFTSAISLISLDFSPSIMSLIQKHNLHFEKSAYEKGRLEDYAIVIVAVDAISLQEEIFKESKNHNCLCNAVDSVAFCDFIFPSYIKEDDLTIAISTSGSSPAVAKHLKKYFKTLIPSGISFFLKEMKILRQTFPKGKERMKMLDTKAKEYFKTL